MVRNLKMKEIHKKVRIGANKGKEITIRTANQSDAKSLLSLTLALQRHVEKSDSSLWKLTNEPKKYMEKEVKEMLEGSDKLVIITQNKKKIIGFAYASIQESERYSPKRVGKIEKIFVSKEWREQGIGIQLLNTLYRFFKSKDIKEITLRYAKKNKEGQNFWKKVGFQPLIITANTNLKDLNRKLRKFE